MPREHNNPASRKDRRRVEIRARNTNTFSRKARKARKGWAGQPEHRRHFLAKDAKVAKVGQGSQKTEGSPSPSSQSSQRSDKKNAASRRVGDPLLPGDDANPSSRPPNMSSRAPPICHPERSRGICVRSSGPRREIPPLASLGRNDMVGERSRGISSFPPCSLCASPPLRLCVKFSSFRPWRALRALRETFVGWVGACFRFVILLLSPIPAEACNLCCFLPPLRLRSR